MTTPAHRESACAIMIDNKGRFLFQQRDDVAGILYPGWVGLFGGHREEGESYLQCAVREVHEEISCFIPPERFSHVMSYQSVGIDIEGSTVTVECYVVSGVVVESIAVTEGTLLIAEVEELNLIVPRLTPSARAAIRYFLSNQQSPQVGTEAI